MKKLFILVALVMTVGIVSAQTIVLRSSSASQDVYSLTGWSAFSSDSVATVRTTVFSLAGYDSVDIWARGTSTNGAAKFRGALEAGFVVTTTNTNFDSIGVAADSTNIKLETLKFIGRVGTKGAQVGRVKLVGESVGQNQNRKDTQVALYIVGRKYAFTGNR